MQTIKESIRVNGNDSNDDNLSGDTTIQRKISPIHDKLYKKIIKECRNIAQKRDSSRQATLRQLKN